jgi:hypothetical protein
MEWIGLLLGLVGIVPSAYIARDFFGKIMPTRRVLGFHNKDGVEVIVTTSSSGISSVGPDDVTLRAKRDLLPSGDLAGVAELSGLFSRTYPRRTNHITSSSRKQEDKKRDQVIVGGPIHNQYAAQLICGDFTGAEPNTRIVFDATNRFIRVGEVQLGPDLDLQFLSNIPQVEYAIVLLTKVHRYGRAQRIMCIGGLTTYGTYAAGHFVAHDLSTYARRNKLGASPNVCILIRAGMIKGQPYDVRVLTHILIPPLDGLSVEQQFDTLRHDRSSTSGSPEAPQPAT